MLKVSKLNGPTIEKIGCDKYKVTINGKKYIGHLSELSMKHSFTQELFMELKLELFKGKK